MKILLFTKKNLFIMIFIFISFILVLSTAFYISSAVEKTFYCETSDNFLNKVKNLTLNSDKIAYLTFDDGPTVSVTPKILDILQSENIKATFFVVGKCVDEHPEIVKRAYNEGHYIANHGYNHNNDILYKSNESFIEEIKKTDMAIGNSIGVPDYCSHVFRFPNGFMSPNNKSRKKISASLLSQMNYTYIDWNCLNNDSLKKYTNAQLLNNLKNSSKNKNTLVILMHDTKYVNDSSLVLKDSITFLKSQNYEFRNFYSLIE